MMSNGQKSPFYPVFEALTDAKRLRARMVHGGKLTDELTKNQRFLGFLLELGRSGRSRRVDSTLIEEEEKLIKSECHSNDSHIIALAKVGRVKLLCTNDQYLIDDFKNRKLIQGGKVYKTADNKDLIDSCCSRLR